MQGVDYKTIAQQGGGIISTVNATRKASEDEQLQLALTRLQPLLDEGVTTVEIKSGYGLNLESELKMLRVARKIASYANVNVSTTLLAAHAVPPEFKDYADRYIDYVCELIIPKAVEEDLVDAEDVFCEGIGFNLLQTACVLQTAKQLGIAIKGYTEQLSNLGGSKLAAEMGALSVDHIEYLDEGGVQALAKNNTVSTLLPAAFYFLRETQPPRLNCSENTMYRWN